MPAGGRKVAFSNKQKKQQLLQKRDRKRETSRNEERHRKTSESSLIVNDSGDEIVGIENNAKHGAGTSNGKSNSNRYQLKFRKETQEDLERRNAIARQTIQVVSEVELEVDVDEVFLPGSELDVPKRPPWDYSMSKDHLDARENKYFREYCENIEKRFGFEDLSYYEMNLETWRQLWRVLEISDIILIIVDIRFPPLLFSPALYDYISGELGKSLILVLNKIDLAPPSFVAAWKAYFRERFPELHVICFTSFPSSIRVNDNKDPGKVLQNRRRRSRLRMAAEGAKRLLEVCEKLVKGNVDLSSWTTKIDEELADVDSNEDSSSVEKLPITIEKFDTAYEQHEKFKDGTLTIGCIGHPNVGKSSLMNALMGKKVVSVSRTPGHTKHFQTIYLTPTVRLCDCPGLVFPSKVPKSLQILTGSYPIAQVREPYTAVRYLSERIPVQQLLRIRHPECDGKSQITASETARQWSALDICDAWAEKRGFITAKAARHDTYRAANDILRMALAGRLCLCLRPPGYLAKKEFWETRADLADIEIILGRKSEADEEPQRSEDEEASDSDSENVGQNNGDIAGGVEGDPLEKPISVLGTTNKFALLEDY